MEITVNLEALCWDTFAEDGTEGDRPLEGAEVTVHGPAVTTDANGLARFENVPVGSRAVRAEKTDFSTGSDTITVNAGATTSYTLTLRRNDLGCQRKHLAEPPGDPGTSVLAPMFWADEPGILLARDVIWVVLFILTLVFGVVGIVYPLPAAGGLAAAVICFGVFSYATHIIFGMIPGVLTMTAAFAAFIALTVFTIMALMTPPPIPLFDFTTGAFGAPPASVIAFPAACALWVGFAVGLAAGRQEFNYHSWTVVIIATVIAAVTAVVIFLVMFWFHDKATFLGDGWAVFGFCCAQLVAGAVAGFVAGLMGHVFINDGNLESSVTFVRTDFKLPYVGERYCVQGHRGFISHFYRRYQEETTMTTPLGTVTGMENKVDDEEFSYDFAVPAGTPILAIEEGHIIKFREDRVGNVSSSPPNRCANFVHVKHRDGSIATYLHLKPGGFTEINATIAAVATGRPHQPGEWPGTIYEFGNDPVHCHAGQQLAAAGNTGNSMFDHIHLAVKRPAPVEGRDWMPFKFEDPGVSAHEGRAFSMRKYLSSNVDRRPVTLPGP